VETSNLLGSTWIGIMCSAFGCAVFLVPLLAILLGNGLIKVDVTPLFSVMGALIPEAPLLTTSSGEPMLVKNKDIRQFLSRGSGRTVDSRMPVKGVYMFDQMGPLSLIDFSLTEGFDANSGTFDFNMTKAMVQTGVPSAKYGGIGPYLPGGWLAKGFAKLEYNVRFFCPPQLADGDHCILAEDVMGAGFPTKEESMKKPMVWHMIQQEGGRKFVRDSWLAPPWSTNDETYRKTHAKFHVYNLLRLVDADGNIDEEHFKLFMEKQDGQDLTCSNEDALGK